MRDDVRKSKALKEVIAVLRSNAKITRAERDRLAYLLDGKTAPQKPEKKAVKKLRRGRPPNRFTRSNNAAILELVFGFMENFEQLVALRTGNTPSNGSENPAMMIASLKPRSAGKLGKAITLAADWFKARGVASATRSKIENVVRRDLPKYAEDIGFKPFEIKTPSVWRQFKEFDAKKKS